MSILVDKSIQNFTQTLNGAPQVGGGIGQISRFLNQISSFKKK